LNLAQVVCVWVVHELSLGDAETRLRCVWVLLTLVRIEIVVRTVRVLLHPTTGQWIHATVDTSRIGTSRRKHTTLIEWTRSDVHATWVGRTVRLTTSLIWAETITGEFFGRVRPTSTDGDLWRLKITVSITANTWLWLIRVLILFHVTILLVTSWILGDGLRRDESLRWGIAKGIGS
jgi:hypothetical protein